MVTPDLFFEKREMIVFIVSSPGGAVITHPQI
jgi:hypothetical protein